MDRTDYTDAKLAARALAEMDEPWRERFLELAATMATGQRPQEHMPEPQEIAEWLENPVLRQYLMRLLRIWKGER